jgi:integrase/recombinase XerD
MCPYLLKRGLLAYLAACKPAGFLFNGYAYGSPASYKAVQWIMREAVKKAAPTK